MTELVAGLPLTALVPLFAAAAAVVWWAGTHLTAQVDQVARRFDLGQAFAGMVLLGGITSLPELAAVSTASISGDATLAVNNLLGSAAVNILLLVIADVVFGRDALTRVAAQPGTLMQGVLGMMLMGAVACVVLWGDLSLAGVGLGAVGVAAACVFAMRVSSRYERRDVWRRTEDDPDHSPAEAEPDRRSTRRMLATLTLLGLAILAAGALLSLSAEGIATQAGLSSGMVGFLLVAFATSLPELSSVTAAVRARRYELAVGDIFGTNLFNLTLLLVADLLSSGEPVLAAAGPFEALGALVALLMTGAFLIGLLERGNRTLLRMGYDAIAAFAIFVLGVAAMSTL